LVRLHAADRLPPLQPPEVRPRLHPELLGAGLVEAARPLVLDQGVPHRRHAVVHAEGGDPVAVALELIARLQLRQRHLVGGPPDHRVKRGEQPAQPHGPVHHQATLAPHQRERLQHPRQAEHVVGVEVGDEHLVKLHEPHRPHELALGALPAVEQQPVSPTPDERGGQPAARGGS